MEFRIEFPSGVIYHGGTYDLAVGEKPSRFYFLSGLLFVEHQRTRCLFRHVSAQQDIDGLLDIPTTSHLLFRPSLPFSPSLPHHVFLYHYLNEGGRDDGLGNITC